MDDELIELDFCCPECHCSQWYQIDYQSYICGRCNYFASFDFEESDSNCELVEENYE